ncbi:MAG: triple tyrosine motif-containing protein [Bacteroidota bacterium]
MGKTLKCLFVSGVLLLRVFAASAFQTSPAGEVEIQNFSKQLYHAESQNWSITADREGIIYAANNIGLLEFDGIEWDFHPAPNGTVIRSVAVDPENRIFTSGYRELGYWSRDSIGKLNYVSLKAEAEAGFSANEEFWNTIIMDGKVYFMSFTSLFIYDYHYFEVVRPEALINAVNEINGSFYLHLSQKGIYRLNGNTPEPYNTSPEIAGTLARFILPFTDGRLLVGTANDGLFLVDGQKTEPYLPEEKEYFAKNEINRGSFTPGGELVIGTILDGVSVFSEDGRLLNRINNEKGLQNNTVLGIYSDRSDNIWLSLDNGIDYVSLQSDQSYSLFTRQEVGAVYSAAICDGMLYLGANQGLFCRPLEDQKGAFRLIAGTLGQTWSCNVFDGQLFISHNNGTFLIRDNEALKIPPAAGGFSLIQDPANPQKLVQSTYSSIVFYEKEESNWKSAYILNGFNDLIRYIEMDHLNNLWASHMHRGVYRLRLNDRHDTILQTSYFGQETFGKDYDIQVFKIENRIVFTTGNGIFTYDDINDTIIPYRQLNEQLGRYALSHRIISGPEHHYWFISRDGIALFRNTGNISELIREYPADLFSDHLIMGFENILPLDPLNAILCLDNGYATLHAGKQDLSRLISDKQLSLKEISVSESNGNTENIVLSPTGIRLPYNRNSLALRYSFPLYSAEKIYYQSYIEGLDNDWSEPIQKPEFSFKRLPYGSYVIHVRAFNKWHQYSLTSSLPLTIAPPWYLKKVSFVLYGLFIIAMLLVFRNIIVKKIREREQKIREQKEQELFRLRNDKLHSELSFKSQELANATMSMIKKNEFLLELKEHIKAQKEQLGVRYPDKFYHSLLRKIDQNVSSIDDWKIFETHFERAHEKFLQKLITDYPRLSHSDLRLCAYLRMNLSSKEIAPLMRISVRGVENHRYRLRKKLNLKAEENLTDFILAL